MGSLKMVLFFVVLMLMFVQKSFGLKLSMWQGKQVKKVATSAMVALSTTFLALPQEPVFASGFFSSSIKLAAVEASVFQGSYNDPNHPNCLRKVVVRGKDVTLVGSDSPDGMNQWVLKAKEDEPGKILVDFSPKGGPKNLLGEQFPLTFIIFLAFTANSFACVIF